MIKPKKEKLEIIQDHRNQPYFDNACWDRWVLKGNMQMVTDLEKQKNKQTKQITSIAHSFLICSETRWLFFAKEIYVS